MLRLNGGFLIEDSRLRNIVAGQLVGCILGEIRRGLVLNGEQ